MTCEDQVPRRFNAVVEGEVTEIDIETMESLIRTTARLDLGLLLSYSQAEREAA